MLEQARAAAASCMRARAVAHMVVLTPATLLPTRRCCVAVDILMRCTLGHVCKACSEMIEHALHKRC